jgi:hypothetical protein
MTAGKFVPIRADLCERLIILLGKMRDFPALRHEAADLVAMLGEAAAIAGDFLTQDGLLAAELLEAIARKSGRHISTQPHAGSLTEATDALADLVPMLGTNVLQLPRAANRPAPDPLPPLSLVIMCDGKRYGEALDVWAVPAVGTSIQVTEHRAGEPYPRARRLRVLDVCQLSARVFEVVVPSMAGATVPEWMAAATEGKP